MVKLTTGAAMQILHLVEQQPQEVSAELREIYQGIAQQINQSSPADAGPLLERIVAILEMSNARSILGGKTLRMLRNALLLPSELRALEGRLASGQLSCCNCGRSVDHMEGMVVRKDGDKDSRFNLYCFSCFQPAVMPCETPKCEGTVEMPDALRRYLRKSHGKCAACKAGKKAEAVVESPAMEDDDDDDFDDAPPLVERFEEALRPRWENHLRAAGGRLEPERIQWTEVAMQAPRVFRVGDE